MCPHSRRKGSPEGVPRFPGSFQIWGALRRLFQTKPSLGGVGGRRFRGRGVTAWGREVFRNGFLNWRQIALMPLSSIRPLRSVILYGPQFVPGPPGPVTGRPQRDRQFDLIGQGDR